MKIKTSVITAFKIWFGTALCLAIGIVIYLTLFEAKNWEFVLLGFAFMACIAGGFPAFLVLLFALPFIEKMQRSKFSKFKYLITTCFQITVCYGLIAGLIDSTIGTTNFFETAGVIIATLFGACMLAVFFLRKSIELFFTDSSNKTDQYMESQHTPVLINKEHSSNKILVKGLTTGVLILAMLIPTLFISNLVSEREQRQKEVVQEVSNKWATAQTVTGPYLSIPYTVKEKDEKGKEIISAHRFFVLPDEINVNGTITPEERKRSIYNVLLYKSKITGVGNFVIQIPKDVDPSSVDFSKAEICMGLSDFKGIEEKLSINFADKNYELAPGLSSNVLDTIGLSAPVNLTSADLGKNVGFNVQLKLKGSEQLHFVPLSGNSKFSLQSNWANPAFDGNSLPNERQVNDSGFKAAWVFNKANLPFGTVLKDLNLNKKNLAFGVAMLQPADQYAKTSRSIKYAILIIGLSFSLFFITELLQKKPLHPVQYVLIGIALIIFYTLLLSISEFLLFDTAYLIASIATILLIAAYLQGHFKNWKTSGLFVLVLSALYGFIFILIRLEDTALLVGSIGLFIVLTLVMMASRKINWYHAPVPNEPSIG